MIKNIAVALHAGTPDQRNAITTFFQAKGYQFWHYIDDFWIVQVPKDAALKGIFYEMEALPSIGKRTIILIDLPAHIKHFGRADPKAWDWLKGTGSVG